MRTNINKQSLLEALSLGLFSALMLYLLISGKYLSYVTPKMAPYLFSCSLIMLLWAVSKLSEIKMPAHRVRVTHCLVLIVPILFTFLPHSSVSSSGFSSLKLDAVVSGSVLPSINREDTATVQSTAPSSSGGSLQSKAAPTPSVSPSAAPSSSGKDDGKAQSDDLVKKYNLTFAADGSIDVPHEKYYQWLSEIFINMNKYEGVKVTIRGFVFKESNTMSTDQFVPARMLMSCCAADLVPCGIICSYDKASALQEGSWVTVTGTIHVSEYQGRTEPQILVTSVSPAEKPKDEYVYPVY
jgi:TIGR03943 family protein